MPDDQVLANSAFCPAIRASWSVACFKFVAAAWRAVFAMPLPWHKLETRDWQLDFASICQGGQSCGILSIDEDANEPRSLPQSQRKCRLRPVTHREGE